MAGFEGGTVTSVDGLAALYAQPNELYELDHVDAVGRAFIAASPFLVLATGSRHGLDCLEVRCLPLMQGLGNLTQVARMRRKKR
jgi:hypothetical protein